MCTQLKYLSIVQSDELAAAKVFEEFKASFEDTGKGGKTFVRGQVINPDNPGTVKVKCNACSCMLRRLYHMFQLCNGSYYPPYLLIIHTLKHQETLVCCYH